MKQIFILLLILILFAFPSTARADVAPPYNPPGSNPQPGNESTQVRMVAETVLIEVQNDTTPDSLGSARVTAGFTMQNLGTADESMAVRFPISAENGRGEYPEIASLLIRVNERQAPYRRVNYPDVSYQSADVPWAEFDVTFPAGKDTAIQISYTLEGTGYPPFSAFYYILETGAGWKDTIGSADIILRLPYPASPQNVILDEEIGWANTTPGAVFQGNEVRWHFENFEPGPYEPVQNMEFALVSPAAWNMVLIERENLTKNPNDGEAWGRLARAYKQAFFLGKGYRVDAGGEELYRLSLEAYEKCLALKPDDAQWHAGFADLLVSRSYWDAWRSGGTADTFRGLNEIRTALALAPDDPKVQEIALNIHYMFPDGMSQTASGYDFPWLTKTPTPIPPTPTIAPVFDPAAVSGVYRSDILTFSNNKKAQLVLTLHPDHSVELEHHYENEPPVVSSGSWQDNGDGTFTITATDPVRRPIKFVFKVVNNRLQGVEYTGFYGEAGVDMEKVITTTPVPAATSTPALAATLASQPAPSQAAPSPTPIPRPSLPICGSAVLVPLFVVMWAVVGVTQRLHNLPTSSGAIETDPKGLKDF